jgi:hypothetical protein
MARALRYDGLIPSMFDANGRAMQATPEALREMRGYVEANRPAENKGRPFDIVVEGVTPGDDQAAAAEIMRPWAEAGATWWIEALWNLGEGPDPVELIQTRIEQGPPRIA